MTNTNCSTKRYLGCGQLAEDIEIMLMAPRKPILVKKSPSKMFQYLLSHVHVFFNYKSCLLFVIIVVILMVIIVILNIIAECLNGK